MKLPPTPKHEATARTAFTLVELLVVIAIIVILVSPAHGRRLQGAGHGL